MITKIETLTDSCARECAGFDITRKIDELKCSKLWLCKYGSEAILRELAKRFEDEEHNAFNKTSGLKEHAVWNKAIRIIEEYLDER